jgi:hypothetical protein
MRPLFVGRAHERLHPAMAHYGEVPTFCKENAIKNFTKSKTGAQSSPATALL